MNFERKYISFVLLSIYFAVFAHNVMPHIHHSELSDEIAHLVFNNHHHHYHDDCQDESTEDHHHDNELAKHCHDNYKHEYNQYDVRITNVRLAFVAVHVLSQYENIVPFSKKEIVYYDGDLLQILPSWDQSAHSLRAPPAFV